MAINRLIEKEFRLPSAELRRPFNSGLLRMFGIDPNTSQETLACGLILVDGLSAGRGTRWSLIATTGNLIGKDRSDVASDEDIFGKAVISHSAGLAIRPEDVLGQADSWIRESGTVEWVPAPFVPLSAPAGLEPYMVSGLLLVRASDLA